MQQKLERIMLVDDDVNTNLYNQIILKKANVVNDIVIFQNGLEALKYLETGENHVNLIFLDINMPIMNGWQFLEKYNDLDEDKKANKVIVMLTSSINEEDKVKAKSFNVIGEFVSKPLKLESITHLLEQ